MSSKLLLDLAFSEKQTLDVNIDACKRVLYRQNECQICEEICPEQAISLELGPTISDNCTCCGLCVNACPTEVFQNQVDLEKYWLDQIQGPVNQSDTTGNRKVLAFHCQYAQENDDQSIAVYCVGNINENLLLSGVLIGSRDIVINTGDCNNCALSKGVVLFNESFNYASALTQLVNIEGPVVQQNNRPKLKNEELKLSRRAFFSKISRKVKDKAVPADYARVDPLQTLLNYQEEETRVKKQPSQRRHGLRKLLEIAAKNIDYQCSDPEIGYWHKMHVEQDKCVACAICVNVCPTGALEKTIKDNYLFRHFTSAQCTNCGLCQEACPEQIIHFEKRYKLSDIIEEKPELVARVELTGCQICGETIPTIEGAICTTCQKRQVSPLFLN